MYKTIIAVSITFTSIAFAVMAYVVNREDTVRMEIAAQNGLVQCRVDNYVLWKKACDNK